ncbi:MAG TPA: flagellar hook-associated protein FlgK [Syntrophomonadaceae bacterium]|nr:flagellar hook-associated protein FlgK [Syntrophomonadaceae bacterium]
MNATFTGINIATRGLAVSQASISVTTNNQSNANTTGYSRQVVKQNAVGAAAVYAGSAILGNGVQVTSVDQIRDTRLDQRYWQENTRSGEWSSEASALTELESVLDDSSSSNTFSTTFNNFYSGLEDLENNPSDSSTRTSVRSYGEAICQYLNDSSSRLEDMRKDENSMVKTDVDEINSYARQIADLNAAISGGAGSGANINSLKDQRNVLIDKLSNLTGIIVTTTKTDSTTISINGTILVDGGDAKELTVIQDSSNDGMYKIQWKDTGNDFTPAGGELKAALDLRDSDGSNSTNKGIPYYINQLNKFAQTLAKAFNEGVLAGETSANASYSGHAGGETANNTTGIRFFSYNNTSSGDLKSEISSNGMDAAYEKITAANITLSSDIEDDVNNIAAASSSGGSSNSDNVSQLISLLKDSKMFNSGTPEDFYNSIISTLSTDSATAQRRESNASSTVKSIDDQRTSVSGVDSNEETANLTKYQSAYTACAKMVEVWNELLQKTIDMIDTTA